jgi:hypothetical protein
MITKFYLVERNGVPAIWQSDPKRIAQMLRRKKEFTVTSEPPSETRPEALRKLRQAFPGHRLVKPHSSDSIDS